jgi:integrase
MPKTGEAKGRALSQAEFDAMLAATKQVRRRDPGVWTRYLYGLWLSGLRLEESLILSWDREAPFCVDLMGRRPVFRIQAKAQKARRSEVTPLTPDFATWLSEVPEDERHGLVFKLPSLMDDTPLNLDRVGKVISDIGRKAGVVVNRESGKTASAHDLRRSFGTRWAKRVMPAVLQRLMRHANVATTMRYYVDLEAGEVADDLWDRFGPDGQSGNTSGNNRTAAPSPTTGGANADASEVPELSTLCSEGTSADDAAIGDIVG